MRSIADKNTIPPVTHTAFCGLLFFLLAAVGCRDSTVAYVRGTVGVDGTAFDGGWIIFRDGKSTLQGEIKPGGLFILHHRGSAQLPCGKYGVAVMPPAPEVVIDAVTGDASSGPLPDDQTYPLHCRSTETSGIVKELGPGRHVVSINFTGAQ